MHLWWGKSSSKEGKKKPNRESIIEIIHRKFRITSEDKSNRSGGSRRCYDKYVSERVSRSRVPSRSPSPSKLVSRCQSFVDRSQAPSLPLPGAQNIATGRSSSGAVSSVKPGLEERSKPAHFLPPPKPGFVPTQLHQAISRGDLATASMSSNSSSDSEDQFDSHVVSPLTSDYENGNRTAVTSPSSFTGKGQFFITNKRDSRDILKLMDPPLEDLSPPFKPAASRTHVEKLQIPHQGAFLSATDSSKSSPSRSPIRAFGTEQVLNCGVWVGKTYSHVSLLGSGQCSSPGSGQTSGHNSIGGDILGQLPWQNSRCSPEWSPIPSPRMTSPGPSSRINSGAVSPLHPRAGIATVDSPATRLNDVKQQSHRLPLPPLKISNTCPFSPTYSTATSPSLPRSPNRAENLPSPGSRWKKGRLLGRGTFGDVYLGFNSESGEMCAMKEVTLVSDDAKSKESVQQLGQEIALLSRLRHPNIVRYYGSEMVDDKLYIYLEFVSGGSIHKLLQEYGQFGELAIRSYTKQILSGLAYLHAKNTVHRDIKGANILVDPNGRVKLADFGMAKHITGQYSPLSFKGSPYWMAPEVIKNSSGCNLAVDIWSLGCTVLEMATTKPPWSQFEGIAAMFKIGSSKELPAIPDTLSNEGKDFIRQCLQRNPQLRPTAAQLMDHPFVKNVGILERSDLASEPSEAMTTVAKADRFMGIEHARNISGLCSDRVAINSIHVPRGKNFGAGLSDVHMMKNASCPVSPVGSPLLCSRSSQHLSGRISPTSGPHTASGSSTPCANGDGVTLYHHHSQQPTTFLQERAGAISRYQNSYHINSSNTYHKPRPAQYLGKSQASYVLQEIISSENATPGGQSGQSGLGNHWNIHDGQSVLADCVPVHQKDPGELKMTVNLNPCSSKHGHTNGRSSPLT